MKLRSSPFGLTQRAGLATSGSSTAPFRRVSLTESADHQNTAIVNTTPLQYRSQLTYAQCCE
eukprot:2190423-Amphidinium_carterae.1